MIGNLLPFLGSGAPSLVPDVQHQITWELTEIDY